ncbi:MAG: peptidase MA family metallohydrolase [Kofleriaceae bacterium]
MSRRRWLVVVALAATVAPAAARRDAAVAGEAAKAVRLLGEARLDEARPIVAELVRRAPDVPEVRWLESQVAFLDGDYPRAVERLTGLGDAELGGEVGAARRLATRTRDLTAGFVHRDSPAGHFQISYAPGRDEVLVDLAGDALDRAWAQLGDDLGWRPTTKVRVEILGAPADLAQVSPLTEAEIETTGTIALSKYEKLMLVSPRATLTGYPWLDALVHEYVHYVVAHVSHDTVPVWLHEGLARFQQVRWRSAPSATLTAIEQQLLAAALKNRRLIDFDAMHPSMAKLPSAEAAALAYAEVFTLVAWLHGKVGYAGLREALALQQNGKSARRALAEVVGTSWAKLDKEYKAYLRTLDLSAGRAAGVRNAKHARIRWSRGGAASDNLGVDEIASAKARKFARLGGMLRARGLPAAAAIEYGKALAANGTTDPTIAGKLARVWIELGEYAKAAALAEPLAAVDDTDAVPAVTLGLARAGLRDAAGAVAAFEQAVRVSPFDPAVRCGLADGYAQLGDPRAARERAACQRVQP